MADLLGLSARIVDDGIWDGPGSVNRVTTELSEVAPGVALVEAFSHVVVFDTGDGLVLFDTSLETFAPRILASLRGWSAQRVHSIVYTHGHVDHVGGAQAFLAEAGDRGEPPPRVVAHEDLPGRFARYGLTHGYNAIINARQFGGGRGISAGLGEGGFGPSKWVHPDFTFRDRVQLTVGELDFELRHARGETDDHLWAWVPRHRALCTGDFLIWFFPNAGNPQKVQRYPLEWAAALREMAAQGAELLLPAHGLPIAGADRIRRVLEDVAGALETLVAQTLELMNQGARLDDVVHAVRLPEQLLEKPYLRPVYDEPEFVVRNIWRLYGGWYDGNPAHLKPAPEAQVARELAALAGGADRLAVRARELAEAGELRLACHLVELAVRAAPGEASLHGIRREVYERRRAGELSLMSRGIFGAAARESAAAVDED
ncbi:MAG: alkyl sulfatase dimerization domain-containing protein [Myxococcota bacterium]